MIKHILVIGVDDGQRRGWKHVILLLIFDCKIGKNKSRASIFEEKRKMKNKFVSETSLFELK